MGQTQAWLNHLPIQLGLLWLWGCGAAAALYAQDVRLPQPEIITARQGLPQAFVPAIVQDRQGFIWMATRDGLCRYDGNGFYVFQPASDGRSALSSPGLTNLVRSPDGRIWISTDQRELDCFDPVTESFLNFSRQPYFQRAFGRDTLETFYLDRRNQIWLSFRRHGLVCFELKTHRFRWFTHQPANSRSLGSNSVTAIMEDGQGVIWVATTEGLDQFDYRAGHFKHFRHQPGQSATIPENHIQQLYRRANGDLWLQSRHYMTRWQPQTGRATPFLVSNLRNSRSNQITTDSRGNDYLQTDDQLLLYTDGKGLRLLTTTPKGDPYVSLFVDQSDALWAGTNLAGVYKFNLRATSFTTQPYRHSFHNDLLTSYFQVPDSQLPHWPAGTTSYNLRTTFDQANQFWFTLGGTPIYRLDPRTKILTTVPVPFRLHGYEQERPALLATDPAGLVWVVHPDWCGYHDPVGGRWTEFPYTLKPAISSVMLQAVVDRKALWIITEKRGLYRVDRTTGQIQPYNHQPLDTTSLTSNNLYCLAADPLDTNVLWVGTFGNGLCRFDKRTGHCQRITTRQGLPNNVIYAAIPDRIGSVWVATNQGLGQLNRNTGQVRIYTQEDGIGADEFNRFHALQFPDGRIVLGTIYGLVGFNPDRIQPDTYQPRVQLSDILINNRLLSAGPLTHDQTISQLNNLTLPYNQNFVTFHFAAMQYNRLGHTQYRYRLTNLQSGWVTTSRPEAIYTALSPGTYQLQIQAANTAGQWSRYRRLLTLTITPPWWATNWAYSAYTLLTVLLGYGIGRIWLNRLRLRQAVQLRQQEADQLRALDALKDRFFTNITHEFRTPLTLILTPAEQLREHLDKPENRDWQLSRLNAIDRSAHQLLRLVNQLLDLSKLEANALPIEEIRGNLSYFIRQAVASFELEAQAKSIQLLVHAPALATDYWFDADKLERIMGNLIANALKFSEKGRVVVHLSALSDGVRLAVSDTGIGIPADKLPHIFSRFYQADDSGTGQTVGTGIGLALVKELVNLQGGDIQVVSTLGKGSTFTVRLPYRPATVLPDKVSTDERPQPDEPGEHLPYTPVVLVVEDNAELGDFIADSLPRHYQLHRAADGQEGLELALTVVPDLIISDVMMPRLDGYELVERIKAEPLTSHIPLMLLTAKTALDSRLTGLSAGADDYLTKPFHVRELQLRVHNLLEGRRRLRERLRMEWEQPTPLTPATPADDPLLQSIYVLLDANLDNSEFSIDNLTTELGLSRMSLHRKLKALTDLSAGELIRHYRLKRATQLLQTGHSVSETAYTVGFGTPAYFTKRFREQYGLTPSQWMAQQRS